MKEFLGECVGVQLTKRGANANDKHIEVRLCVEDDGIWHEKLLLSSHWLDEMIEQLTAARDFCKTQKPDIYDIGPSIVKQFGWRFK